MAWITYRYYSEVLGKQTTCEVLHPQGTTQKPLPVLFLLHGLSDDASCWQRYSVIERLVGGLDLIVVMPDGGRGFYVDAVEGAAYGTALGKELPELIRSTFHTTDEWCISGLSMGGYGALALGLRRPDLFRSIHSMSGALGWNRKEEREFQRIFGEDLEDSQYNLKNLFNKENEGSKILLDCGVEDFLIEENRGFAKYLTERGIEHTYREHPGAHTWDYWNEHVVDGLEFHRKNLGF